MAGFKIFQGLQIKFSEMMSLIRLSVAMLTLCSKNNRVLEDFKATVVNFTENQVNRLKIKCRFRSEYKQRFCAEELDFECL